MESGIGRFLNTQPWLRVVRALFPPSSVCCLRELVDLTALSPAGVSDIIRRLDEAGALKIKQRGNRKLYQLQLSSQDRASLAPLMSQLEEELIRQNARGLSKIATKRSLWNEEALKVWRKGRASLDRGNR